MVDAQKREELIAEKKEIIENIKSEIVQTHRELTFNGSVEFTPAALQ